MQYPKISIVTVNYNKVQYLERTIQSVLNQDYPNLEYVIIDGGSTDGSVDIIKKYSDRLAFWISEPDEGMYYALRKGFEHTTGEILAWINSDDMYHRNAFYSVAEIFSSFPQVEWLTGMSTHWDEMDRCMYVFQSRYFSRAQFLSGDYRFVQQESSFWRRSLYEKSGGINTQYKLAGDFSLWMQFSRHAKMYVVDALIGGFRVLKGEQLSKNFDEYISECEEIISAEVQTDKDKREVSYIARKNKLIERIYIFTHAWINVERLQYIFFKEQKLEELQHRIEFDRSEYKYKIRE